MKMSADNPDEIDLDVDLAGEWHDAVSKGYVQPSDNWITLDDIEFQYDGRDYKIRVDIGISAVKLGMCQFDVSIRDPKEEEFRHIGYFFRFLGTGGDIQGGVAELDFRRIETSSQVGTRDYMNHAPLIIRVSGLIDPGFEDGPTNPYDKIVDDKPEQLGYVPSKQTADRKGPWEVQGSPRIDGNMGKTDLERLLKDVPLDVKHIRFTDGLFPPKERLRLEPLSRFKELEKIEFAHPLKQTNYLAFSRKFGYHPKDRPGYSWKQRTNYIGEYWFKAVDLTGFEHLSNLREFEMNDFGFNEELDLTRLGSCKKLRRLSLAGHEISSLDLAPLAECTELEYLDVSTSSVMTLEPLASCGALRSLILRASIERSFNLSPLANCHELRMLDLSHNRLQEIDLSPLSKCESLTHLILGENNLSEVDLSPLGNTRCIVDLDASRVGGGLASAPNPSVLSSVILPDKVPQGWAKPKVTFRNPRDFIDEETAAADSFTVYLGPSVITVVEMLGSPYSDIQQEAISIIRAAWQRSDEVKSFLEDLKEIVSRKVIRRAHLFPDYVKEVPHPFVFSWAQSFDVNQDSLKAILAIGLYSKNPRTVSATKVLVEEFWPEMTDEEIERLRENQGYVFRLLDDRIEKLGKL